MDDELDKLLGQIESDADYSRSRAGMPDERPEVAVPEGNAGSLMRTVLNLPVDEDLLRFYKGVHPAIDEHLEGAKIVRRCIGNPNLPENVQNILQKHKYAFIRSVEGVEKLHEEYYVILAMESLYKLAKRDYTIVFSGFEEDNKVDFIVLGEIFQVMRDFNSKIRKEWSDLMKNIGVLSLVQDGKDFLQEISSPVEESLKICAATDRFLERIALILKLQPQDYNAQKKDFIHKVHYEHGYPYSYDAVFNLANHLTEAPVTTADKGDFLDLSDGTAGAARTARSHSSRGHAGKDARVQSGSEHAPVKAPHVLHAPLAEFNPPGKSSWNMREPYIIKLDLNRLEKDYDDLSVSFYFLGADDATPSLEGAIKRAMIHYLAEPSRKIEKEYGEFIFRSIISVSESVKEYFNYKGAAGNLFTYHLGPLTTFKQLLSVFYAKKEGLCCKYLPGNRVVRFMPAEYIKDKVLGWHEKNINSLKLEFDTIHIYEDMRKTVHKKYSDETFRLQADIDAVMKGSRGQDSGRTGYFSDAWARLFGAANIPVYNRFLERTLFK
jgi:hypothetical protein